MKSRPSDPPPEIAAALEAARPRLGAIASSVHYFESIGSTNDVALRLAAESPSAGPVVIADEQSSGRGRRGRAWFSPPGSGLYVSIVLTPSAARGSPARATGLLTLAIGVALAEGVEAAAGLAPDIKWPNDLTIGRRKLAGILTEAASASDRPGAPAAVVTGFGINVGPMAYPPELADRATSLETELGRPFDKAQLLVELLAAVARRYEDLLEGRFDAILDTWRQRSPASKGTAVSWETPKGIRSGVTAGLADDGALLVRTDAGTERIVAGELTWAL